LQEVEAAMSASKQAFIHYAHTSLKERAALMRSIAIELDGLGDEVIQQAMQEYKPSGSQIERGESANYFPIK